MAQTVTGDSACIEINGRRRLHVSAGASLLETLAENKVFLPTVCRGKGLCGLCKVRVLRGGPEVTDREIRRLDPAALSDQWRLACQIQVTGQDLAIEVPEDVLTRGRVTAVCAGIEDLTYDIRRFRFNLREPATLPFVPGQYMQFVCPAQGPLREQVTRAFSIASPATEPSILEFIIRKVPNGICTTYLFNRLGVGDDVTLSGPYGDFRLSDTQTPMIFVAGGSGMAPLVSILHHMVHTHCTRPTAFFFGGNRVKDLYLLDLMHRFEGLLSGFRFVPVVALGAESPDWGGQTGLVTEAVARACTDLSGHEGYLCGPPGMIDAATETLSRLGMPKEKIYFDRFA